MSDILYDVAYSYKELMQYEYVLTGGTSKRKIIISILSSNEEIFTHICGLDHLKDIPSVVGKNVVEKKRIFKNILNKRITFETISKSKILNDVISKDENDKSFNIKTRIEHLTDIKKYFDEAYKGKLYRWNKKRANYTTSKRHTQIDADYMLVIPTDEEGVNMFFFFFQSNKSDKKDKTLKLTLHSAFVDSYDLSVGQQMLFTILKETRINKHTKEETVLYVNPSLHKEEIAV